MTTRILPPDEWHKLQGTEAEPIVPGLDPVDTRVLVVEQDGEIIGSWVMLRMVHVECVWIAPAHRGKAGVLARLLSGMTSLAKAWRTRSVITGSIDPRVSRMIRRLGGLPLPGEHFALPVGD
jgi:hypothetical protein